MRNENLNIQTRGYDPEGDGAEGRFGNLWVDLESCACLWKILHDHKNRQEIKTKSWSYSKGGNERERANFVSKAALSYRGAISLYRFLFVWCLVHQISA